MLLACSWCRSFRTLTLLCLLLFLQFLDDLLCFVVDFVLINDVLLCQNAKKSVHGQFKISKLLLECLQNLLLVRLFWHLKHLAVHAGTTFIIALVCWFITDR